MTKTIPITGATDGVKTAGKDVEVYVCHPVSSETSLIKTSGGLGTRITFELMSLSPMLQSAEKGACPEVMGATETGLAERAICGPTGVMEFVGPVGKGKSEPHAHDKATMVKLWKRSEKDTAFCWDL